MGILLNDTAFFYPKSNTEWFFTEVGPPYFMEAATRTILSALLILPAPMFCPTRAEMALKAVLKELPKLKSAKRIGFVIYDGPTLAVFQRTLKDLRAD